MADEQKPEERARVKIDEQLVEAGWHIADRSHFTYDHKATALTEGLLEGNHEADYLLFVDGKVIGVLEAKRSVQTGSDMVTTVNYHTSGSL